VPLWAKTAPALVRLRDCPYVSEVRSCIRVAMLLTDESYAPFLAISFSSASVSGLSPTSENPDVDTGRFDGFCSAFS